jgi:two-component system nitrate/nitrite response regulator NarL
MKERTTVFVADDHPLLRGAVTDAIKRRQELKLVGEAGDGRKALEEIRALVPDVALLDMRMPGLDGAQVLNAIIRDSIETRVLFLATETDSRVVFELISAGAAGYLDKGKPADEICDAIAAVGRGKTVISDTIEDGVFEQMRLRKTEEPSGLSQRELEVLPLLADGLSSSEIGKRLFIGESTVKTHLRNLYGKLGVSDRASAVAEGMRRGLVE